MPTYDYVCRACEHRFEHFQSMQEPHLRKCPQCGKDRLERLIGSGAGILFKGSGFYETDYKRPAASATGDKSTGGGKDQAAGGDKAPGAGKDSSGGKDSGSSGKATEKPVDTPREKRPGGDVPKGPAP